MKITDNTTSVDLPSFTQGEWYQDPISHNLINLEYDDKGKQLKALIDRFKQEFLHNNDIEEKSRITKWTVGHTRALTLVLLNSFVRLKTLDNRTNILIYWLKKYYNKGNYYSDKLKLSATSTHQIINNLYQLKYIDKKTGTSGNGIRDNGTRYSLQLGSRIKPTAKLAQLLNTHLDIDSFKLEDDASISFKEDSEDESKKVYTFNGIQLSTHNQRKVRQKALRKFNNLMQRTVFSVGSHNYFMADTTFERQFIGDFKCYGRYHCHRLQNMPSELRPYLLMDGEPTVEIDIVSSNILMAYASKGIDLSLREAAYTLPNVPCDKHGTPEARENRKLLKQALLILMNTTNRGHTCNAAKALLKWCHGNYKGALKRISEAIYATKNKDKQSPCGESLDMAEAITDALRDKHIEIDNYLRTKASGLQLMYLESEVISDVIAHFTKLNVPCLPIHDSLLVPLSYEEELRSTLVGKIQSQFNIQFSNTDKVIEVEQPKFIESELEAAKVIKMIEKSYHDAKSVDIVRYDWNPVHINHGDKVSEYVV